MNEENQTSNHFKTILPFYGGIFSQWYSCRLTVRGLNFNCAEQYMMYCKANLFNDKATADRIMASSSPRKQKAFGRKVRDFNNTTWMEKAQDIVFAGNFAKFSQNPKLKKALADSGEAILVEASPYDTIWGVGLAENDPRILDPTQWLGTNLLGYTLMEVRTALGRK